MSLISFLTTVPLFNHLTEQQQEALSHHIHVHPYQKGELIFRENEEADRLFIIQEGEVKIYKLSEAGKEKILHIMHAGDILAEVPMFEGTKYPAYGEAIKKTAMLSISRKEFTRLIKKDPQIALNMLALQAKRLREFTTKIESLSSHDSCQKLIYYLLDQSNPNRPNDWFELKISISSLANLLSISRENLSRTFAQLIKNELLEKENKYIRFLDKDKLLAVLDGSLKL